MPVQRIPGDLIVRRGEDLFEQTIKSQVFDRPARDYLAIDVESGDFEVGADRHQVMSRLLARHPEAQTFMRRVGSEITERFGGRLSNGPGGRRATPDEANS
jgi:hypothetical protein